MDYPIGVSGVNLDPVTNKFSDGNPGTGQPASTDRAEDMNQVFDELIAVIAAAGETPNAAVLNQVLTSIQTLIATSVGNNSDSNSVINGGCIHGSLSGGRPNQTLTTSFQYAGVDRFAVKCSSGGVTGGTISHDAQALVGTSGYACSVLACTLTGTGAIQWRYRLESRDVQRYINIAAIIADCKVYQDTGAPVNYTIALNTPTAQDNFASVTNIATSGNIAVPSATPTPISFSTAPGNCTNGLEVVITASPGTIANKNLRLTELQVRKGSVVNTFQQSGMAETINKCRRYYLQFGDGASGWYANSSQVTGIPVSFGTMMRTTPTCSIISGGNVTYRYAANNSVTCANMGSSGFDASGGMIAVATTGSAAASIPVQVLSNTPFQADAEL